MNNLRIRKVVSSDCALLLEWANDPVTRQNAINQHQISYEEHCRWFELKLRNDACCMYILEKDGVPVGQVRVDIADGTGEIDYSVAPSYRGMGYGRVLIALTEAEMTGKVSGLYAEVKKTNIPSRQVFEKNGWINTGEHDYLLIFEKKLS